MSINDKTHYYHDAPPRTVPSITYSQINRCHNEGGHKWIMQLNSMQRIVELLDLSWKGFRLCKSKTMLQLTSIC